MLVEWAVSRLGIRHVCTVKDGVRLPNGPPDMKFRNIQLFSTGTMFMTWAIKFAMNPMHLHKTMLIATVAVFLVSELSYRAGRKEQVDDLVKVR